MNKSILFCISLLFSFVCGHSQAPFIFTYERSYPAPDENHFALDLDTLPSGNFISLAIEKNNDDEFKRINVTTYDQKGSLEWTRTFEYAREYELLPVGDIALTEDDSIIISIALDTVAFNRAITKIGQDGGYGWTKLYHVSNQQEVSFTGRNEIFSVLDEGYVQITDITSSSGSDLLFSKVDVDGEIVITNSIDIQTQSGTSFNDKIVDAQLTISDSILIVSNADNNFMVTKMSRFGDVDWVRSYESPLDNVVRTRAQNFVELANGDIAIITINTLANNDEEYSILRINEDGDIKVNYTFSSVGQRLVLDEVGGLEDTTIIFSGFRRLIEGEGQPFMAHLGADTSISWSSFYRRSLQREINGFTITKDGAGAMFTTGGTFQTSELERPYLVRVNSGGTTLCHGLFEIEVGTGSIVSGEEDDLRVVVVELEGQTDTISVMDEDYNGFSPPILMLQDTTFCPQDPISYTVDATVRGGIGYLWSSEVPNPIGPIVTVTEEGEYSVTVTIGQDVCFSLCDTFNVNVRDFPMVQIIPNFAQLCETGEAILAASANNPIVEIQWSTGVVDETRIGVTTPGNYRVTIVDDCGNPAEGSINLSQADFDITLPLTVEPDNSSLCQDGTIAINLIGFTGNPAALSWSNGQTGVNFIRVSEPGTYSVTFDGFCPGFAELTLTDSDFLEEATIDVNQECGIETVRLVSATNDAIIRLSWSTGESIPAIEVVEAGTYTVTGFDICGDAFPVDIEVTPEDLTECNVPPSISGEPCLEFPNAFVPESRDVINKIFAPKNDCANLDNYELRIYNRWGGEVFKSVNVSDGWDGTKGSSDAPADVYFFYSVYGTGGTTFEEKGDLLLIR